MRGGPEYDTALLLIGIIAGRTAVYPKVAYTPKIGGCKQRRVFSKNAAIMNDALFMTPREGSSRKLRQAPEPQAVKKVVLLLGHPAEIRKRLEKVVQKNKVDVRPPPRWGLND